MIKPITVGVTSLFLIGGIVVNIILKDAPFNYNLKIVSQMQRNAFLSSTPFIVLMNIVSNLFNPIACAGYVLAFYVVSHRKMEILVFLLWFILLSVGLSFMKALIHQARPYWMGGSNVDMLEWTCYTEYGCPSGHSMLGLILIEFIIRFINRTMEVSRFRQTIMLLCGLLLQGLVVYSRMILGMHSLNQVLFGFMLGFGCLVIYYSYAEVALLKLCILVCYRAHKRYVMAINTILLLLTAVLMMLTLLWPTYENDSYLPVIFSFGRCKDTKIYNSFQYKCFQDMSLLMAGFGIIYALALMKKQQNLNKSTIFPRLSKKFFARLGITVAISVIPVVIFLNPLWRNLKLDDKPMAILLWFNQCMGLLLATTLMVALAPWICSRFGLESYLHRDSQPQMQYLLKQKRKTMRESRQSRESRASRSSRRINPDHHDSIEVPNSIIS